MNNTTTDTEHCLLNLIAIGDELAMVALYDSHSSLVYKIALSVLGDQARAEEVLIAVFLQVWTSTVDFVDTPRGFKLVLALCVWRRANEMRGLEKAVKISNSL